MKFYIYCLLFCVLLSCSMSPRAVKKINGVSFVAARDSVDSTNVSPVVEINANYAAIMPFGFIKNLDKSAIEV